MKLQIPAGLPNSDIKEKLSPTIGQPKFPGISSIAFGEPHERTSKKADNTNKNTKTNISRKFRAIV